MSDQIRNARFFVLSLPPNLQTFPRYFYNALGIAATRERLRPSYTSILCYPLFSELYLRSSALSVRYCWK